MRADESDWDVDLARGAALRAARRMLDNASARRRPASDLLARAPDPAAAKPRVVQLGCGDGSAAADLRARFGRAADIRGYDASEDALAGAVAAWEAGHYNAVGRLTAEDVAAADSERDLDVIFASDTLHRAAEHRALMPALMRRIAPGGVLAVEMPRPGDEPWVKTLRDAVRAAQPDAPPFAPPSAGTAEFYAGVLEETAGALDLWETRHLFRLSPVGGGAHPARSFLERDAIAAAAAEVAEEDRPAFMRDLDRRLRDAYPLETDGGCWIGMRRLFLIAVGR